MRRINLIAILFFILTLSGCGPVYETTYSYQPPRSDQGRMCVNQCLATKTTCEQMGQLQDENCRLRERQDALTRYQDYTNSQQAQGKKVELSLSSFDNSYRNCGLLTKNCAADFNLCYQNCGGVVSQQRVCTAFCN